MGTKLTVVDNLTQEKEREAFSDKDLSGASLCDMFAEFGLDFDRDLYYFNKYIRDRYPFS